jgi:hypothetical protein
MCEVDESKNAINEGVAEGYEGINSTYNYSI